MFLAFSLYAQDNIKLNQSMCNGSLILIEPKIEKTPEGFAIQIVSFMSKDAPSVLVTDNDEEYEATIISQNKLKNKFIGYIILKNNNITSLLVDDCRIDLEIQ